MEDCTGQYTCKQFSINDYHAERNVSYKNSNRRHNKIFERFVLVSDQQSVAKFTFMPSAPTPPPLWLRLFFDFLVFSFSCPRNWPLKKLWSASFSPDYYIAPGPPVKLCDHAEHYYTHCFGTLVQGSFSHIVEPLNIIESLLTLCLLQNSNLVPGCTTKCMENVRSQGDV